MRIYIDSADMTEIKEALASGFVYGVTTNPTLLRRAGVRAAVVSDFTQRVIAFGVKELHLQTYSGTRAGIIEEGTMLSELAPKRVVVKIPATPIGYSAAAQLAAKGIRVTLTAVYTVRQAVVAQSVGAAGAEAEVLTGRGGRAVRRGTCQRCRVPGGLRRARRQSPGTRAERRG